IFAGIGLFGLIASFHGTILASSRQVFAMARSGYLPKELSVVNQRFRTPHLAIIAGGVISFIALFTGTTGEIVVMSVMGAITMYMMSMISLFVLRKKEPALERPFVAPFFPVFPAIALIISVITLITMIYFYLNLSLIFFAGMAIVCLVFRLTGKHKVKLVEEMMVAPVVD
ncbi:MAG TPA: amino acid permease, partial [Mucilaginibacter sp.]|nr:amino acid permease [Mucilaginibacter sp.]